MSRELFSLILIVALVGTLAGCGFQQGDSSPGTSGYQWRSLYRQDIKTVAVPTFNSTAFQPGVEFALSKAIINQIESRTPYKVVDRDQADTILEGEIVAIRIRTVSRDRDAAVPQEQLQSVTVNFLWKDLRSGKILKQKNGFEETRVLYPTLGESQFVGTQQAVESLATAIVDQMQAEW